MDRVFEWVRKNSHTETQRMNSHDTGSSDGASQAMLPLARVASNEQAPVYTEHDVTPLDRLQSSANRQTDGSVHDPGVHSMVTLLADSRPDKHKKNYFMKMSLCHLYGMFLITIGMVVSVSDPFVRKYNIAPIFFLVLCSMGMIYLLYLVIDIWMEEIKDKRAEQNTDQQVSWLESRHYTFDLSKHASNFYLKLGAAAFAMGHLIHFVLMCMVLGSFNAIPECMDTPQLVLDIVYMFYSFLQLIFVFKYNNIIILKRRMLARFGFMHFIAINVSFWIWTIVQETTLALYAYYYNKNAKASSSNETVPTANFTEFLQINNSTSPDCFSISPTMKAVFKNFSPYLFPFTVEFSIIMGGFFLIIWLNIGKNIIDVEKPLDLARRVHTLGSAHSIDAIDEPASKFTIYADCHASSRGIMTGFFVLVVTMANLMICFILANIDIEYGSIGAVYTIDYTKLALHVIMLATVIAAYYQTRELDVNTHPISYVDDIMLLFCIPGFFLDSTLTMVATINTLNVVKFMDSAINAIQVVLQTSFLMDRMRRCCNSRELRRSKPGRQLVMFLLITNVTMWLFNTFSYKSPESKDERYAFYGKELWTVLGHVSLPLIMFYRFHSSVCLADIWQLAYQKSDH